MVVDKDAFQYASLISLELKLEKLIMAIYLFMGINYFQVL